MNLDFSSWRAFAIGSVFTIYNGRGITSSEIEENPGTLNAVQSGEENNGVIGKISADYCRENDYVFTENPCLTVARTGSAGFVSFQANGCVVGDSAKILQLRYENASTAVYLFLQSILNKNRFKFSYGRKVTEAKYARDLIDLPVEVDESGSPVIDPTSTYSSEGYIPDWQFMEDFIKSLEYKPLSTSNKDGAALALNESSWEDFKVEDIFDLWYGVNLALNACTETDDGVNFVSRTESNNGVSSRIAPVDGLPPQQAGLITTATGGSVLSTFLQPNPFYSGRDLYVMEPKEKDVGNGTKLFLITVLEANKFKFNYGRQANKSLPHIKLRLPIQRNSDGAPVIDSKKSFHNDGYIPDWQFMEDYMRSLPYGDRIPGAQEHTCELTSKQGQSPDTQSDALIDAGWDVSHTYTHMLPDHIFVATRVNCLRHSLAVGAGASLETL